MHGALSMIVKGKIPIAIHDKRGNTLVYGMVLSNSLAMFSSWQTIKTHPDLTKSFLTTLFRSIDRIGHGICKFSNLQEFHRALKHR